MWNNQRSALFVSAVALTPVIGCAHGQRDQLAEMEREVLRASPDSKEIQAAEEVLAADTSQPLDKESLVRAVLARNPSLESARFTWEAVVAKQPQATALDDPRVSYSLAPASIRSSVVQFGQVVRVEQRFPWPGTLGLSGEAALSEAQAAKSDYEAIRLDLALMASFFFDEYARIVRLLELNGEHRQLTEEIKSSAMAQYEAGRASQQEPLQAEVELSHVLHEEVVLEAELAIVVAQLNRLLHRLPHSELPPPVRASFVPMDVGDTETLQELAIERRPALSATQSRVLAQDFEAELAEREFFPDLGLMGEYNSMWRETQHRWMVGVSLNLPIQIKSRRGRVDQANAELSRARADLESLTDEVRTEVDQTRRRVVEAHHVLTLYRRRLLPAAEAQIRAAKAGYESGRTSFQALIDAERSLRTLQTEYENALATYAQQGAALDRALGRTPGISERGAP